MRQIILAFISFTYSMVAFCQHDSLNNTNITYDDYKLLKEFLLTEKNNPGFFDIKFKNSASSVHKQTKAQENYSLLFSVKTKNYWDAELNNNFYERLRLDMKKEFAPVLYFDSRFVAQSIPNSYGSQNYQWVPATDRKYNPGAEIIGSVIGSFLGIKPDNKTQNGYYTPSGIKY